MQWLTVVIAFLVFGSAFILTFQPYLDEFVYEQLLATRFERRFGFRGGRVRVQTPDGERSVYTILHVTPGGALERAGFRVGDVPSGGFHSQSVYFMRSLSLACEQPGHNVFIGPMGHDGSAAGQRRIRLPCVP